MVIINLIAKIANKVEIKNNLRFFIIMSESFFSIYVKTFSFRKAKKTKKRCYFDVVLHYYL